MNKIPVFFTFSLIVNYLTCSAQFPDSPLPLNIGMFEGVLKRGYERCDMVYKVDGVEFPAGFIIFENGLPIECEMQPNQMGFASLTHYEWDENNQLVSESGTTWTTEHPESSTLHFHFQYVYNDGMLVSKQLQSDYATSTYSWYYPVLGKGGSIRCYIREDGDSILISETYLIFNSKSSLINTTEYYEIMGHSELMVYKTIYDYNPKGLLLKAEYLLPDGHKTHRFSYKYDENGILFQSKYEDFDGGYEELMEYRWK